ncbi:Pycsar system effector family protein [Kribbella sp. NPDC051586]|uniref:Pycsar system effector family protein n=1 Tax=Kribbella sp. NPDC051586 TaxID=3364118 RepID=UPI0037B87EAA
MTDQIRQDAVRDLLDRTRTEIVQADSKAAILLAGVLAMVGSSWAVLSAQSWRVTGQPPSVAVLFWIAALATFASIGCLAAALYPRRRAVRRRNAGVIAYFDDVAELGSVVDLKRALRSSELELFDVWADQVWQLSRIVRAKYRLIRWAIRGVGTAVVAAGLCSALAALS